MLLRIPGETYYDAEGNPFVEPARSAPPMPIGLGDFLHVNRYADAPDADFTVTVTDAEGRPLYVLTLTPSPADSSEPVEDAPGYVSVYAVTGVAPARSRAR